MPATLASVTGENCTERRGPAWGGAPIAGTRHTTFRDWLRAHDDDRDRYAELKLSLAAAHRDDRRAYTDAKSDFIRAIEDRSIAADAWRGEDGGHHGACDG